MEINHGKHVKLICSLEIGMKVTIEGWGYKFNGKVYTIQDIKRELACASGFLVKIDGYDNYIDSDWISIN